MSINQFIEEEQMAESIQPTLLTAEGRESTSNPVVAAHLARADNVVGNLIHKLGESKVVKRASLLGASGLFLMNAACSSNDNPNILSTDYPTPSPTLIVDSGIQATSIPTPSESPSSDALTERDILEREIESKFGVRLVSMREGFGIMGVPYDESNSDSVGDEAPVRWDMDRLNMTKMFLEQLPQSLTKDVVIMLADYRGTKTGYAGLAYPGNPVIGVDSTYYNPNYNIDESLSLLIHELMHKKDERTGGGARDKIIEILGNVPPATGTPQTLYEEIYHAFSPGNNSTETLAGLGQLYVKGHDEFVEAMGIAAPAEKVEALYSFIGSYFFDGEEFEFPGGIFQNPDSPQEQNPLDEIAQEFSIRIVNPYNLDFSNEQISHLKQVLSIFPKNFYSTVGEFPLVLVNSGSEHISEDYGYGNGLIEWQVDPVSYQDDGTGNYYYLSHVENLSAFFAEHLSRHGPVGSITDLPPNVLREILGGYKIEYQNPIKIFPSLKRYFRNRGSENLREALLYSDLQSTYTNVDKTLVALMDSYLYGRNAFFKDVVPVIGRKKANESYRLINGMYSGQEFSGDFVNGIPVPLATTAN